MCLQPKLTLTCFERGVPTFIAVLGMKCKSSNKVKVGSLTCCSGYSSSLYTCVSTITTATSTSLCNGECADFKTETLSNNSTSYSCLYKPSPFSWNPQQSAITVQEWISPIYIIHQESDIPKKGLSTTAKIAIGVVVPVVVLFAIVVGGLFFMRKLRKRKRSKSNAMSSSNAGVQESKTEGARAELHSESARAELPSECARAELP